MASYILLPFLLLMAFLGATLYEKNPDLDIYNKTNELLTFNHSQFDTEEINYASDDIQEKRISNVVNRIVDTAIYIIFEIGKISIEFGFTHSESKNMFIIIVIVILLSYVIGFIIPLLAIIYLSYRGIKFLYNKIN